MSNFLPVSTLFGGIFSLMAIALSYVVAIERTKKRVWHGVSLADVSNQPDYLKEPGKWAAFVENYTQKSIATKSYESCDDGVLQRKVRAFGNFMEYVPLALLLIILLELVGSPAWLLWLLGIVLTIARIAHAWGVIGIYGASPFRAIGFFLTWLVYLLGAAACLFYSVISFL
ncbi:MAPEG family protein [Myxosarcina sp. GI1]|uniref:MAPEG family protein n=1 Tax=Myxosarcina sp. GI1 TaxID=1541065 RepID=UPI000569B4B2|nr:MAPEG family protein [Myxosarcina sp. GI1]